MLSKTRQRRNRGIQRHKYSFAKFNIVRSRDLRHFRNVFFIKIDVLCLRNSKKTSNKEEKNERKGRKKKGIDKVDK